MTEQAAATPDAEVKLAPVTRLVSVDVTIFFQIPVDEKNWDAFAIDSANETLRGLQRCHDPESHLIDYGVNDTNVFKLNLSEAEKAAYKYDEDDATSSLFVEEETQEEG